MFHGRSTPASTVEREALAYVIYRAFLFIRMFADSRELPEGEKARLLSDLAEALHNVPMVMERYAKGHDADYLVSLFFRAFDAKWKHVAQAPKLESTFRSSIEEIRQREASHG